jgi:hypothetical protein
VKILRGAVVLTQGGYSPFDKAGLHQQEYNCHSELKNHAINRPKELDLMTVGQARSIPAQLNQKATNSEDKAIDRP